MNIPDVEYLLYYIAFIIISTVCAYMVYWKYVFCAGEYLFIFFSPDFRNKRILFRGLLACGFWFFFFFFFSPGRDFWTRFFIFLTQRAPKKKNKKTRPNPPGRGK